MTRIMIGAAMAAASLAAPLMAHDGPGNRAGRWVYSENNPHYRDYLVDLSEARRELRGDLRRAKTSQDRLEARQEYRREVADARYDFTKEMAEKGYAVQLARGTVTVTE